MKTTINSYEITESLSENITKLRLNNQSREPMPRKCRKHSKMPAIDVERDKPLKNGAEISECNRAPQIERQVIAIIWTMPNNMVIVYVPDEEVVESTANNLSGLNRSVAESYGPIVFWKINCELLSEPEIHCSIEATVVLLTDVNCDKRHSLIECYSKSVMSKAWFANQIYRFWSLSGIHFSINLVYLCSVFPVRLMIFRRRELVRDSNAKHRTRMESCNHFNSIQSAHAIQLLTLFTSSSVFVKQTKHEKRDTLLTIQDFTSIFVIWQLVSFSILVFDRTLDTQWYQFS